jgi:FSR family fosmidomycin resistance protein-like MFS transporter
MTSADLPRPSDPLTAPTHWKPVGLLTGSHALIDLCQGMVPALLPFLVADLGFSYAAGAGLVFATSAASSVIQPLFGHVADRWSFRWLLPLSVVLTGAGLALGSQSPHYAVFFMALVVSGLGVAAFHPEAARQVHRVTGPGRSTEMSVFAFGGGLGFALAPLVTTALVAGIGRIGTLLVLLPTGLLAMLLAGQFSASAAACPSTVEREAQSSRMRDDWAGFIVLSFVTICRSIVFAGFNTFLALYWMSHWGSTPSAGATILGLFLGAGLCGTLLGGRLADSLGHRAVLRAGFGTAAILLPMLLLASDSLWAMVLLVFLAVAFFTPSGLLVVLGQGYLPNRIGIASGVTLGLAVSVGGMIAPALGVLADRQGVEAVMLVVEAVLVVAVLLSLLLPHAPSKIVQDEEDRGGAEDRLPVVLTSTGLSNDSI